MIEHASRIPLCGCAMDSFRWRYWWCCCFCCCCRCYYCLILMFTSKSKTKRYRQWFMNAIEFWQIDEMSEWICNQYDQSVVYFQFVSFTLYNTKQRTAVRSMRTHWNWAEKRPNEIGVNINGNLYSKKMSKNSDQPQFYTWILCTLYT